MGTRHGLYSTQVKNEVYEVKILVFVDRTSWSVGHRFGKIFASLWFCQLGFEAAAGNSTLTGRQGTGKGRGGVDDDYPFFELKADNFLKNNMLLEFYSCFSHRLSLKSILGGLPIAALEHSGN